MLCANTEERLRLLKSNQSSLTTTGFLVKKQSEFKNQDYILTSIVRNLCGAGGLAIGVVELLLFFN